MGIQLWKGFAGRSACMKGRIIMTGTKILLII